MSETYPFVIADHYAAVPCSELAVRFESEWPLADDQLAALATFLDRWEQECRTLTSETYGSGTDSVRGIGYTDLYLIAPARGEYMLYAVDIHEPDIRKLLELFVVVHRELFCILSLELE